MYVMKKNVELQSNTTLTVYKSVTCSSYVKPSS